MKSLFLNLDILAPNHQIAFDSKFRKQTYFGAISSIIITLLSSILVGLLVFDYFFFDIPFSSSILRKNRQSKIRLDEFLISFVPTIEGQAATKEFLKDFNVEAILISRKNKQAVAMAEIKLEVDLCKTILTKYSIDLENKPDNFLNAFCLNPFRAKDYLKAGLFKDYLENNSESIVVNIRKNDSLREELFKAKYSKLEVVLNLENRFINIKNYSDPLKFRYKQTKLRIGSTLVERKIIRFQRKTLKTDGGLVFKDVSALDYVTSDEECSEYFSGGEERIVGQLLFSSSTVVEVQFRWYGKMQTLLAEAYSLVNLTVLVGQLAVKGFSQYKMYLACLPEALSVCDLSFGYRLRDNSFSGIERSRKASAEMLNKSSAVTFWEFLFLSKATFDKQFLPRESVQSLFDLARINKMAVQETSISEDSQPNGMNLRRFVARIT